MKLTSSDFLVALDSGPTIVCTSLAAMVFIPPIPPSPLLTPAALCKTVHNNISFVPVVYFSRASRLSFCGILAAFLFFDLVCPSAPFYTPSASLIRRAQLLSVLPSVDPFVHFLIQPTTTLELGPANVGGWCSERVSRKARKPSVEETLGFSLSCETEPTSRDSTP